MVSRTIFLAASLLCCLAPPGWSQTRDDRTARRHFVTISSDWLFTHPLHFAEHPLADLAGVAVAPAQREAYDYASRDGATLIDVLEFGRRQRGAGISFYPFGMSSGPTLMLRGSYEHVPRILIAFDGPARVSNYALSDGRALDGAVGITVADRSPGWGLGSHVYGAGGVGRISSGLGDGRRVFGEAGGGVGAGPAGVELAVKFAWNTLSNPVDHGFLTVPVTLRGTLTF